MMKSYLSLIPAYGRIHKKQNRMTLLCIVLAVFLVTSIFGMADMEIRSQKLQAIKRYGSCMLPMDETLALCAVDLSGRPYLSFDCEFPTEKVGYMDTEMVREFFYAVSYSAGMNLHLKLLDGKNSHHMVEALFKAFGRALDEATQIDPRITDILSTKGSL